MADRGASNKKWTEDEKIHYLVKIIEHYQAGGAKVAGFQNISIPNRTPKACQNYWDKIRHHHADYINGEAAGTPAEPGSEPGTPALKTPARKRGNATPGSRKRTAEAAAIDEGGDANETPATPTVKRQRRAPAARPKAKAAAAAATTMQVINEDEPEPDTEGIKAEGIKSELKMEQQQPQQNQNGFDYGEI
ncbi:hypothetical protein F4859DRAFT_515999 [Xylaria cf. heliscus]|nr:hypothetical protein F4859DRAFT_515999 [Xylaria cf. heliscus]